MRRGLGILLAVWAAATVAAAPGKNNLELRRQPKVGETAKYHVDAAFNYKGRSATMRLEQAETVSKVEQDGTFEVETTARVGKLAIDGQEQSLPDAPGTLCVYDRLGALLTIHESADATAYRKAYMLEFVAPDHEVRVGDKWLRLFKADSATGALNAKTTFQVQGLEKCSGIASAKIHFAFEETEGSNPISSDGFAWVSTTDGSIIKLEAKFKNLPMGVGAIPVDGTFTMARTDP